MRSRELQRRKRNDLGGISWVCRCTTRAGAGRRAVWPPCATRLADVERILKERQAEAPERPLSWPWQFSHPDGLRAGRLNNSDGLPSPC